jgi:WD40 repeat protein
MKTAAASLSVIVLLTVQPLFSHHSFAAEFDGTKPVTLKGTITRVEWVNPHGWIYVAVKGADGTVVNWAVETGGPNALSRRGVRKSDFPVGTEVVITGYKAKNGTATANAQNLTLPDGRQFFAGSSGTGAPGDGTIK